MKKINFILMLLISVFAAKAQETDETVVELSLGQNYNQEVYYQFPNEEATLSFAADSWDVAFYRQSSFEIGTRINNHKGIKVYQVSQNPEDWSTIDPTDNTNWIELNNSDSNWQMGAFDYAKTEDSSSPFSFAWGMYDPTTHQIMGEVIFLLEYPGENWGEIGGYKKFMIENFSNGYTFKYATWDEDNQTWIDEHQKTIGNGEAPENSMFNYFDLKTGTLVEGAPSISNWNMVFMQYETDLSAMTDSDDPFFYKVTGVLQNPTTQVARSLNSTTDETDLNFSENINTIGHDWKSNTEDGEYEVDSGQYFFLKTEDENVYRFHFLSFDGASTGNLSFAFKDITDEMDVEHFDFQNSLRIYPNPTAGRQVNVLLDMQKSSSIVLQVYDLNGRQIIQQDFVTDGFSNKQIDLSELSSGIYIFKFSTDHFSTTKKLILN